jgi:hypothetical protein
MCVCVCMWCTLRSMKVGSHNRSELVHFYDTGIWNEDSDALVMKTRDLPDNPFFRFQKPWRVRTYRSILKEHGHENVR